MRKAISFILVLFCSLSVSAQTTRALFIGNSYTSVNNLPDLVSQMYSAAGETLEYSMSAPGGCTFQQHCSVSLPYVQQGDWDYVVLQEQSQLPSFPESQFMQESYPYAQSLCSLIRQYNPDVHIAFYMTWGRRDGDSQNGQYYPPLNTYEGMDSLLRARYLMMASDNNTMLSPVGAVWHYIRDNYPELELYQSDGSHPSYFGSYVAACCFYTTFTGRNPLDISWNGSLDESFANVAKNAVKRVVYDSLSNWNFETDTVQTDTTGIDERLSEKFSVFPNPSHSVLHIRIPKEMPCSSLMVRDMNGRIVCRQFAFDADPALDVSGFSNGTYLLEITSDGNHYTKTFTVSH